MTFDFGTTSSTVVSFLSALARAYGPAVIGRISDAAAGIPFDPDLAVGHRLARRMFETSRGDRLESALRDLGEQPSSPALADVLRAQVQVVLETDAGLATDVAAMLHATGGTGVTISHSQGVQIGDRNTQTNTFGALPDPPVPDRPAVPRNTILMVMSNPAGTDGLRLDEEYRAVAQAVQAGGQRDRLTVVPVPAARFYDVGPMIHQHRPVVVHFGGHGSGSGGLVLVNHGGQPVDVPTPALADTFRNHRSQVRCVVLNGCFTRPQADAIATHVPCVVGTSHAIPDELAVEFARGFYVAVANGGTFAAAFDAGRNRIDLGGRGTGEAIVLLARRRGRLLNAVT